MEEIRVALCDDEKAVYLYVKELMYQFEEMYQVRILLDYYSKAGELLAVAGEYELVLLDIEMPEMDGIEFGQRLLKEHFQGKIIILSGVESRFKEVFKIGAYRFVSKPIDKSELFSALLDFLKTRIGMRVFSFHRGKEVIKIAERDIYTILSKDSSTVVFTESESFHSEKSLREWEEELEKKMFFRCHRQAIVNLKYIYRIEKDIILENGDRVLLSRRKRTELRERYIEYDVTYQ